MSKLEELIKQYCPDGVEYVKLGTICDVLRGKRLTKSQLSDDYKYPVIHGGSTPMGFYTEFNRKANTTIVVNTGNAGSVFWYDTEFWSSDACFSLYPKECLLDRFLYHFISGKESVLKSKIRTGAMPTIDAEAVTSLEVPLPALPVQREIVRILDEFSLLSAELAAELAARKKQYEHYRKLLFEYDDDVTYKTLPEIAINRDKQRKPVTKGSREAGKYPYYGASGIVDYVADYIFDGDYLLISEDGANLLARVTPIAFSISGKNWVNNHAHVLQFDNYELRKYVEIYLNSIDLSRFISGGAQPKLNQENLNKIPIPVPIEERIKEVVEILERFDVLCTDISSGLPAEIEARQKQYEYYRDKLLSFKRK